MTRTAARLAALAATLGLAACSTSRPAPGPAPVAVPAPRVVRSIAVSPGEYVTAAASASLFAIRASDLIIARQGDTGLGQFAERLKNDHGGIGSQLSFAGRRLDLLPSAALLPRHQAMLDDIAASTEPSAAYVRHLKTVLPQAMALHRSYDLYGTSATLRPVAGMAWPQIAQELAALRRQ